MWPKFPSFSTSFRHSGTTFSPRSRHSAGFALASGISTIVIYYSATRKFYADTPDGSFKTSKPISGGSSQTALPTLRVHRLSIGYERDPGISIQQIALVSGSPTMEVFSIIEGHFGNLTAQVVKDCFLPFLMDPLMQMYRQHSPRDVYHRHGWFAGERPLYHRPPTNEIHLSVTRSFKALDKELLERFSHVPLTKSAACVVAAMYENFEQLLHVANLGNNIAILGRPRNTDNFYDVHVLSGDHSTDNLAERESIRALHPGEDLIHNGLFFGRKYTRAFGATLLNSSEEQIKTQRNLPESFSETAHPEVVTPPYMSSNPEVTDVRIMRGDVVVLGSSWLSDCLSKEEIVGLVGVWLKKRSDVTSGAWEVEEDVERDTLPVQLKDDTTEMYARWNAPKRFINIERNVATHLAQNAMGGANTQLRAELMDYRRTDLPRKELAIVVMLFE
ncbi:phosphatase 2C-like domain-containing protein [Mycena sp. CBHHK59/15]|nr:phosphatase 2C-like domain-containing protein [Mycena sp. CBHHK59/15]